MYFKYLLMNQYLLINQLRKIHISLPPEKYKPYPQLEIFRNINYGIILNFKKKILPKIKNNFLSNSENIPYLLVLSSNLFMIRSDNFT
jgi:hypothetical protein